MLAGKHVVFRARIRRVACRERHYLTTGMPLQYLLLCLRRHYEDWTAQTDPKHVPSGSIGGWMSRLTDAVRVGYDGETLESDVREMVFACWTVLVGNLQSRSDDL